VSELARRVRVSRSHLSNVEGGRLPASIELVHRIATELGVPVAELLATDDEPGRAAS
jgi:transcriptional regulator with XRE-family HTH domain